MPGTILNYRVRLLHSLAIVHVTQQPVLVHSAQLLSEVGCVLLREGLNHKHYITGLKKSKALFQT